PSCRDSAAYSTFMNTQRSGRGGGRGFGRGGAGNQALAEAAGIATIDGEQLSPASVWNVKHPSTAFTKGDGRGGAAAPASATLTITTRAAQALLGVPVASATKGMTGKTIRSAIKFSEQPTLGGNVVGIIEGSDPTMRNEHVLVDAHYDHLGIRLPAPGSTDSIYNGADDDASGTTAVIEIARAIKAGPPPKRTLIFAATTGEEVGLVGTNWYIAHPVRPLSEMVSNLEIEMIDRPDALAGGPRKAWLTGYERSTMGDTLAAHGVPIVQDPRPDQGFFQRSDNIAFARMGIPAHTLSTFDLHADYHHANDEASLADFNHMAGVIDAGVTAVRLLADGFKPVWHSGCKP
ncbi:MAG TPA: M28 family peptidase, partial [Gemmatimonadaceae bacterium]